MASLSTSTAASSGQGGSATGSAGSSTTGVSMVASAATTTVGSSVAPATTAATSAVTVGGGIGPSAVAGLAGAVTGLPVTGAGVAGGVPSAGMPAYVGVPIVPNLNASGGGFNFGAFPPGAGYGYPRAGVPVKMDNVPRMKGSFDLYAVQLRTFLTRMDCWSVVDGTFDLNDPVQTLEFCSEG
ncbi:hypothetical protein PF008_g20774 [Phytophthora fragariae]|uniref:Uncharacterized protein n=1 Tax=Phytophthora fragariae TaxID=53985 RepID=A0A6G0QYR9_9STRA|nr:hypothetical protein PF008_g20774 [Phytophthora fragariae]